MDALYAPINPMVNGSITMSIKSKANTVPIKRVPV